MATIEQPEFIPVEIEIKEVGKAVMRFALMTQEELDYWWVHDDTGQTLRFGTEMLGKDF